MCVCVLLRDLPQGHLCFLIFFFNDTATTEIYTRSIVGSVRCVQETVQYTLGINCERQQEASVFIMCARVKALAKIRQRLPFLHHQHALGCITNEVSIEKV
eukprot:TRINITY_DN55181_c0_g1_i1.p2 TRINITY_DN55181_c0_g1~~TRINITY_DN55181_c0_g1_i1.p2  ORF type:complete len:101 (+),score=8.10 TRINITY_DN55181_c0_g1_i1:59-361(+)